jgi:DNA polymerase III subunit delta'
MSDAKPRLAPWLQRQLRELLTRPGHAWLLHGPPGLGQLELALALTQTWLCDHPTADGACGLCPSCHGFERHTHADACVLMPETHALSLGWPLDEKAQQEIDDKKRKPSKEIKVDAARQMVAFTQKTCLGGQAQVVLIHPADRMNHVTANALLKTLEEPPGGTRFILTTDAVHLLLPTVRSRCLSHVMQMPPATEAQSWLMGQGVPESEAQALWRASGGSPNWVLERYQQDGLTAQAWGQWPRQLAKGLPGLLETLPVSEALAGLQKLSHDLMAVALKASPAYFLPEDLPKHPSALKAAQWCQELKDMARHVEHPFNAALQLQAWAVRARQAMRPD